MLLGTRKTLHDHAIELLLAGPSSVLNLKEQLGKRLIHVTAQGIYKALRELIAEDIVVKQKQLYSINNVWREKTANLLVSRTRFKLSPGEQVVYRFKKLEHLDAFWKHTLADIELETIGFPVFHFTPHQFWSLVPGRQDSEKEYYAELGKHQTYAYTIIGGNTPLDAVARDMLKTDYHQVFLAPRASFSRRDHISSIENYVITTRVSIRLAEEVDRAYQSMTTEAALSRKLQTLFKNPGSIIMSVEHNQEKAKRLRKKLSADFHISRQLREQFNLF